MDTFQIVFTCTLGVTCSFSLFAVIYAFIQAHYFKIKIQKKIIIILAVSLLGSIALQITYILSVDIKYIEVFTFYIGESLNSVCVLELVNQFNW